MMSERRDSLHDGDDGDHVLQFMGMYWVLGERRRMDETS